MLSTQLIALCALTAVAWGCAAVTHTPEGMNRSSSDRREPAPLAQVVLYASEGNRLHVHALDPEGGALTRLSTVTLPEPVHYAAADAGARFLYVSASNGSTQHGLHAFAIDPSSGALTARGEPLVPPAGRIIHLSVDADGRHLILAHNQTARLSVVRLNEDGSLGEFVVQPGPVSTGFFTHQASIDHRGTGVIACGLGAAASETAVERPGSLTVFAYDAGVLTLTQSLLPGAGLGPRHLDYGTRRVYVAVERGNRLLTYGYEDGRLDEVPDFDVSTLADPSHPRPRQRAGAIHLHPNGKYLYVSNRADATERVDTGGEPMDVFVGGDNDIALYELDAASGQPSLMDHYDPHGVEPRTFSIDPTGRFLIVGNQAARNVRQPTGAISVVPRSLAVFRIEQDARLSFLRKQDLLDGDVFWVGALRLPD